MFVFKLETALKKKIKPTIKKRKKKECKKFYRDNDFSFSFPLMTKPECRSLTKKYSENPTSLSAAPVSNIKSHLLISPPAEQGLEASVKPETNDTI